MRMSLPSSSTITLPPRSSPMALRNSAGRLSRPEEETCPRTALLACSRILARSRNMPHSIDVAFGLRCAIGRRLCLPFGACAVIDFHRIVQASILSPESSVMPYQDILYDKRDGIATITINRPKVLNAFRAETVEEMLEAMRAAEDDRDIGVIVLAGAGDRAFCAGGDNSARAAGSASEGGYGGRGLVGLPSGGLHSAI